MKASSCIAGDCCKRELRKFVDEVWRRWREEADYSQNVFSRIEREWLGDATEGAAASPGMPGACTCPFPRINCPGKSCNGCQVCEAVYAKYRARYEAAASPVTGIPAPERCNGTCLACGRPCKRNDRHDVHGCLECSQVDAPTAPAEPLRGEPRPTMCPSWCGKENDEACVDHAPLDCYGHWPQHFCTGPCAKAGRPASPSPVGELPAEMTLEQACEADVAGDAIEWNDPEAWSGWRPFKGYNETASVARMLRARFRRRPQPQPAPQRSRVEAVVDEVFGPLGSARRGLGVEACNRVLREFVDAAHKRWQTNQPGDWIEEFQETCDAWGLSGDAPGGAK